jgi:hypothetical protein
VLARASLHCEQHEVALDGAFDQVLNAVEHPKPQDVIAFALDVAQQQMSVSRCYSGCAVGDLLVRNQQQRQRTH